MQSGRQARAASGGFKDAAALHGLATERTVPVTVTATPDEGEAALEGKVLQTRTRRGCPQALMDSLSI